MTCTHDDADKAPCPICERDAEIARLEHTLDTIDAEALDLTGPWPAGTCAWEAAIALPDDYARLKRLFAEAREKAKVDYAGLEAVKAAHDRLAAENGQLHDRIRTLEARIEQEAVFCDEVGKGWEPNRAERAARLRALLGEEKTI